MHATAEVYQQLNSIPWFLDLKPEQLDRLAAITECRELCAGADLFQEGEREDFLYVVLDGEVTITTLVPTRGNVRIFTAEPLDIVGWSSLTPVVRQRTANATAAVATRLLAIEGEGLRKLCDDDHDLGYIIMRRVANVVASRMLTTKLQLMDIIVQCAEELTKESTTLKHTV